ncbi:MAG: zinc-dependent peptidase [Imperialibacter sp.]|uniref:zinc-dependent peptidase n=1 Tax=Imperialibacter sp. TaxID=2038411 RepID=UPI0032ECD907
MEYVAALIFALAIVFIVVQVFKNVYDIFAATFDFFLGDKFHWVFIRTPLDSKYLKIISEKFPYHQALPNEKRALFEKKVQYFIKSKEFMPGHDLDQITDEMIALISATAVQITFGYPRVYLIHFDRIYVFADVYQSNATGQFHQGEVHAGGYIALSWKSFVFGLSDQKDGRNLGLHEMAHALRVEDAIRNKEYNFLDYDSLVQFTKEGRKEMEMIAAGNPTFFRAYGATSDQEFFAVAIENFFERPVEFHRHNPILYKQMVSMLKQDPMTLTERYR